MEGFTTLNEKKTICISAS